MSVETKYIVGIDAGTETGIAVVRRADRSIEHLETTDFFGAFDFLSGFDKSDLKIYVEIPGTFIYARNNGQTGKVRDFHAVSIGKNIREAELLAEGLTLQGFEVVKVPPVRETKWTAEQFKLIMKSDLRTNSHERDACRLAFIYANKRLVQVI